MKELVTTRIKMMLVAALMMIVTSASAITYSQARRQALFLADKMAYELNLTPMQYEAAYRINLDYLMAVNSRRDLYGSYWIRRNTELRRMLANWQYNRYVAANYFYRPVYWANNSWNWRIYNRYSASRWYNSRPSAYSTYRYEGRRRYNRRSWSRPPRRNVSYSESYCEVDNCNDCDYDDCDDCDDYDDCDYDDCDDCGSNRSNYVNVNNNANVNTNVNVISNGNFNRPPRRGRPPFRFW